MRLRITDVDMNSFLGREHHPTREMQGEIVVPVRMERIYFHINGTEEPMLSEDNIYQPALEALHDNPDGEKGSVFMVWTCLRDNGALVDLMDYEVELVVPLE